MKPLTHLVPYGLALLVLTSATAQPVYRCGNSYSQSPCPQGHAIAVDDARSEAQRLAAAQGLARDKTLAKDMASTRHQEEALALAQMKAAQSAQPRPASVGKPPAVKKPEKVKKSKKPAGLRTVKVQAPEAGVFTALSADAATKKSTAKAPKTGKAP